MLHRLARLASLLSLAALTVVVVSSPADAAGVTSSTITSPVSGTHWLITDANPAHTVTVTGTSNGTTGDLVDIRCYESLFRWSDGVDGVAVQADGSFSTNQMTSDSPYGTCRLLAVPAGYAAGSNLRGFSGPTVTTQWSTTDKINSGPNAGKLYSYFAEFQGLHAMNDFCSIACGGLWDNRLSYSNGFSSSYLWQGAAVLQGEEFGASPRRASVQVDGRNAYLPDAARYYLPDNPGLRAMTLTVHQDPTTREVTIHDNEPLVVCSTNTFPPTALSCTKFVTAGVRLERTIVTTDGGRHVHVTDLWRSTDAKAHNVSAHYQSQMNPFDPAPPLAYTPLALKLPWLSSHYIVTTTVGTTYAGTSTVPNTLFVRKDNTAPDGSLDFPRGAVSFDAAPANVYSYFADFNLRDNGIKVPAGGTHRVRMFFVIGTTEAGVSSAAAADRKAIKP